MTAADLQPPARGNEQRETCAGVCIKSPNDLVHGAWDQRQLRLHEQGVTANRFQVIRPETEIETSLAFCVDDGDPTVSFERLDEDRGRGGLND
jgi:hypothetical protein